MAAFVTIVFPLRCDRAGVTIELVFYVRGMRSVEI